MGRYEFLEGMVLADCALELQGDSLDDLFATGARAVAELMVDPATVEATEERTVALEAASLDLLLHDWLAELIWLKDAEQLVVTDADVQVRDRSPCRLTARLRGGIIDPSRVALRADAKAVTFHQFALEPAGTGWRARVVIDI
jgi:SHS2 domain-containing protein